MQLKALTFSAAVAIVAIPSSAVADATIDVGNGGGGYARPPVVVVREDVTRDTLHDSIFEVPREELPKDPYRAPFRLTIGPAAITSGQGIGPGLLAAVDLGSGTVGVRLTAAWFRGESADDPSARLGATMGLYSGELVLDLHKGGPLHPIVALGLGAVNIGKGSMGDGWAIAGLGRLGLEYAVALEDADVRVGVGLTGALLGPSDQLVSDARAFAMMNATFSIGF